jgi:DNA modification methylase
VKFLPGNPSMSDDGRCWVHVGDVLERLADIPDESVDLVVTSPPYWGLRDYGTAFFVEGDPNCLHPQLVDATRTPWANRVQGPNSVSGIPGGNRPNKTKHIGGRCALCGAIRVDYQIGLEQTLGQHIDVIVAVFDELKRVLKSTGACFMNYGDCYAAEPAGASAAVIKAKGGDNRTFRDKPFSTIGPIDPPRRVVGGPADGTGVGWGRRDTDRRAGAGPVYDPFYATARGVFQGNQWNERGYGTRRVDTGGRVVAGGLLKPKDLVMAPNRIAIALQEAGWWVRSEIVWGKTNAMPDSSGKGRPSTAHEKIFLLTKSADADIWVSRDTQELSFKPDLTERCIMPTAKNEDGSPKWGPRWIRLGSYWDASAVGQPSSPNSHARTAQNVDAQKGSSRANGGAKRNGPMKAVRGKVSGRGETRNNKSYNEAMMTHDRVASTAAGLTTPKHAGHINHTGVEALGRGGGRFLRNYEPAPKGLPFAPITVWAMATESFKDAHFATFPTELVERAIKAGCPPHDGVVLDPFGGSGTTALVALGLGRRAIMIELKPDYADMAKERIEVAFMGAAERSAYLARKAEATKLAKGEPVDDAGPLFREAAE